MAYATKTQVPVTQSQGEIQKILMKYGASGFAYGQQGPLSVVMFEMQGRRIKFILPMPAEPKSGASAKAQNDYAQFCRSKWRSMVLAIKAKLECVDAGITTLEQEFLAHIVLPNGATVGQVMLPQIDQSYKSGNMPPLLGYNPN